jgi:hypothetical protein
MRKENKDRFNGVTRARKAIVEWDEVARDMERSGRLNEVN